MQNSTLGVIISGLCARFSCVSREFSPWNTPHLTPIPAEEGGRRGRTEAAAEEEELLLWVLVRWKHPPGR